MLLRHRVLCFCALLLAAPAAAQSPQVDPSSPAGTEYQLPIDRARNEAVGGSSASSGSGGSTSGEPPLFGAGVEKTKAGSRDQKLRTDGNPHTVASAEPDAVARTPGTVRAHAPAPDSGGSGLVAMGGGALGVLLIGGLAGLALRRRTNVS
jgi:hypothetical protein